MLGTAESIDALLPFWPTIPPNKFANARLHSRVPACSRGEQRLTAVPQLLNLLEDDSVEPDQDLIYAALHSITGRRSATIPPLGATGGHITIGPKPGPCPQGSSPAYAE